MKNLLALSIISLFFFSSCASSEYFYNEPDNDLRYYQSTISNVDRNLITTANGDIWIVNSVMTGKQNANIFLIFNLFDDYEGKAFINGALYNVLSQNYDLNPDGSERNTFGEISRKYKNGMTTKFVYTSNKSIIQLTNGSKYQINFMGTPIIKNWAPSDILILSEDEDQLIHPVRIEAIKIKKLK